MIMKYNEPYLPYQNLTKNLTSKIQCYRGLFNYNKRKVRKVRLHVGDHVLILSSSRMYKLSKTNITLPFAILALATRYFVGFEEVRLEVRLILTSFLENSYYVGFEEVRFLVRMILTSTLPFCGKVTP